ncbi:MAG TPA: hypothetical protein VLE53_16475 [Gemmatimonadaceae bacterium]|nr:hypothetical protein [Gemmatimonadaceae bacterium]
MNELHRDASPPPELRDRVEASLRARGVLAPMRAPWWRPLRAAAVLLAAVALGFFSGRASRASAGTLPRYLLLLYEDSTYRDDRPVREIVGEYARWADSLRQHGALELGEKLVEGGVMLRGGGATESASGAALPTGLFVIRAIGDAAARAIAATSPHLRYGGHIELRAIEHTGDR